MVTPRTPTNTKTDGQKDLRREPTKERNVPLISCAVCFKLRFIVIANVIALSFLTALLLQVIFVLRDATSVTRNHKFPPTALFHLRRHHTLKSLCTAE